MITHNNKDKKETDFMSELDAATHMRPATPAILMLFTVVALVAFIIGWAAISEVEILTRGQGQVVPSKDIQILQSLEGGVVEEILVKEGQQVEKGQILLRISDVIFASQERGAESQYMSLLAQKARLKAETSGNDFKVSKELQDKYPQVVANELALFTSRKSELYGMHRILNDRIAKAQAEISASNSQVARLSESVTSLQEELRITAGLVQSRAVPKLEQIRLERQLNDFLGQINTEKENKRALEAEKRAAQSEKNNVNDRFRSEALRELNEVESKISGLQEDLKSISDRVSRTELRSPVDGVINRLSVTTIGGVVEPAKPLAEIVPLGEDVKIVARITPENIAFVRVGMPAKVKLSAYDAIKYGSLNASVSRIGSNSITDQDNNVYFEIEVISEQSHMGSAEAPLPIIPGMVATTEVITGKRTILYYLLKPFFRAQQVAFTER